MSSEQTQQVHFTNPLGGESDNMNMNTGEDLREHSGSRDYSHTDEWDASKTPPSRFQKRKGSIYATPSSRDGHIERNRDAVEEFHKAHQKRWSISSKASTTSNGTSSTSPTDPTDPAYQQQRRKSNAA
ncbi:hypothetical protein F5Y16DRAFT_63587 [Xylariaceae sp. FL0255]|nr:hypothetical protein F5Y16DRAFT_63587 [Xylariaceae sp. FL0255]